MEFGEDETKSGILERAKDFKPQRITICSPSENGEKARLLKLTCSLRYEAASIPGVAWMEVGGREEKV